MPCRPSPPSAAVALSVNLTATDPGADGFLALFPPGTSPSSSLNYRAGVTRANNAVLLLDRYGHTAVRCSQPSGSSHFLLDVNGYFE